MKNNIFKFSYKLIAFGIILGFIITSYVILVVNKDWGPNNTNNIPFEYEEFTLNFLASFTTQANLIVAGFFLLAAIFHKNEDEFVLTGQKAKIFVTSYISVSGIIWLTVLLPTKINWDLTTTLDWIFLIEPHIVAPALMIYYAVINIGKSSIDFKSYCKKDLWFYMSYPIAYFVYIMLRGEVRWIDGKGGLSYPYPFLNLHQIVYGLPGPVAFTIFVLLILGIFVAGNFFYLYLNNLKVKKQFNKTLVI